MRLVGTARCPQGDPTGERVDERCGPAADPLAPWSPSCPGDPRQRRLEPAVSSASISLLFGLPDTVAVRHGSDPERQVLTRVISDVTGVVEREVVDLADACVSCAIREDIIPTLERIAAAGRWRSIVACLPVAAAAPKRSMAPRPGLRPSPPPRPSRRRARDPRCRLMTSPRLLLAAHPTGERLGLGRGRRPSRCRSHPEVGPGQPADPHHRAGSRRRPGWLGRDRPSADC